MRKKIVVGLGGFGWGPIFFVVAVLALAMSMERIFSFGDEKESPRRLIDWDRFEEALIYVAKRDLRGNLFSFEHNDENLSSSVIISIDNDHSSEVYQELYRWEDGFNENNSEYECPRILNGVRYVVGDWGVSLLEVKLTFEGEEGYLPVSMRCGKYNIVFIM